MVSCDENPIVEEEMPESTTDVILKDRSTDGILTYFAELINDEKVLVGQHCGDGPDQIADYFETYVEGLQQESEKYVGLLGGDLGWYISASYPVDKLIEFWNDGGLVSVSWHADNPFTDAYEVRINSVENRGVIDFSKLLKDAPASSAKDSYRNELDLVASALVKLKEAGVVVLWRPFHEMNGDFFWWGIDAYNNNSQTNIADYEALWRDMYETFTDDYDLDNLIWVYSAVPTLSWNAVSTAYYPGDDVVDLVGLDYYGLAPGFPDFDILNALGKTVVMSESGPIDEGYGMWDMTEHVDQLKGKGAYFLQWHSWDGAQVAIKDNLKVQEMMDSDEAITRDEIE